MKFVIVDAFTAVPFQGNPAAVMMLEKAAPEDWMRCVAREMNLAETAFLVPREKASFDIRWFTPTVEVALCGHATLGSAHALWDWGAVQGDLIEFHSQSGRLSAEKLEDDWIQLDFPATLVEPGEPPEGLLQALGTEARWVGRSKFDYLVQVADEQTVRAISPQHSLLQSLPVRGVIVTAAGSQHDFVSRFFAPGSGIPEDPVTGSAHCALTPFWAERLKKTRMSAFQASSRGGTLRVELRGDRVLLEGEAVTVSRGEMLPNPE